MTEQVRVGIVGDYDPGNPTHKATEGALEHAAGSLGIPLEAAWLPTDRLEGRASGVVRGFDAIWCSPGSPYKSFEGALEAIRVAREDGIPFIGTCGGLQHAVIEFARNVLGFARAGHTEYDPEASDPFVSALSCSPFGRKMRVELEPGSRVHGFYGTTEAEEEYRCNYGLDPERRKLIEGGGLRVSGVDEEGEARVLEMPDHTFYVATLFVPQLLSSPQNPHPLVVAFLRAALDVRRKEDSRNREETQGRVG